MKIALKFHQLPLFALLSSLLGVLLRWWQFRAGMGEDGLLLTYHPAGILVIVLSVATATVLLWFTRHFLPPDQYARQFPPSALGGAGALFAGVCLLLTAMTELVRRESAFFFLVGPLGIVAAVALFFTGLCRFKGLRPHFAFHMALCLFFALRLVSCYQGWSANPQLAAYLFQLLASVGAMLFSYHRAALDLKSGSRRALVTLGLLAGYCCCLSVVASNTPLLYAGLAAWMFTNLGALEQPGEAAQ